MKSSTHTPEAFRPQSSWNRFWFSPTDPTTLGFMRIMTGLICLYVHFAHSFDLETFFGPNAWYSAEIANRDRKEMPWYAPPIDWEVPNQPNEYPAIRLPELLDRRDHVMHFFRSMPDSKSDRKHEFAYLYNLDPFPHSDENNANYKIGLDFVGHYLVMMGNENVSEDPEERKEWMKKKYREAKSAPKPELSKRSDFRIPKMFLDLPEEQWNAKVDEMLRFDSYLLTDNKGKESLDQLLLMVTYFQEYQTAELRRELFRFIDHLPTDREARNRFLDYVDFWGFHPDSPTAKGRTTFSFWFHISNPTVMWIVHLSVILTIMCFTVGFCTRVTGTITWFATLNYIHRSQIILFGMDQMQNILLMYLVIGNAGQALSIDRLLARYRAARAIAQAGGRSVPWADAILQGPAPSWTANFAIRLFQVHFCIIYMAAGLSKLKGTTWWDTSGAWMTIANPEFTPINLKGYEEMIRLIASKQAILALVSGGMVAFTLILEIGLPFWVWTRVRPFAVIGGVLLHAGVAMSMGLTCFGLYMMTLLLSYIPAAVIRESVSWNVGSGPKLKLHFNSQRAEHLQILKGLLTFDIARQLEWIDSPNNEEVKLIGPKNEVAINGEVPEAAFHWLVFLNSARWLRFVPGISTIVHSLFGKGNTYSHSPISDLMSKASKTMTK